VSLGMSSPPVRTGRLANIATREPQTQAQAREAQARSRGSYFARKLVSPLTYV